MYKSKNKLHHRLKFVMLFFMLSTTASAQYIKLTWDPNPEPNMKYYTIYRGLFPGPDQVLTTVISQQNSYNDHEITPGRTYYYRMTATDSADNTSDFSEEVRITVLPYVPGSLDTLVNTDIGLKNYPNPFNPETVIEFTLPESGHLTLKIYDMLGREVRTLVHEFKNSGQHRLKWDGIDNYGIRVGSGIYFCRLEMWGFNKVLKLLVTR